MSSDQIGRLAEFVAAVDLSRTVRRHYRRPLFRATFLGEKYPTVDLIVDALDHHDQSLAFFFVQVKGTSTAVPGASRLPIDIDAVKYNRLVRLPAPSFVIGVDVPAETSYIAAAHAVRPAGVSSIAKTYCLGEDRIKIKLYKEVLGFWKVNRPFLQRTEFKDVE